MAKLQYEFLVGHLKIVTVSKLYKKTVKDFITGNSHLSTVCTDDVGNL